MNIVVTFYFDLIDSKIPIAFSRKEEYTIKYPFVQSGFLKSFLIIFDFYLDLLRIFNYLPYYPVYFEIASSVFLPHPCGFLFLLISMVEHVWKWPLKSIAENGWKSLRFKLLCWWLCYNRNFNRLHNKWPIPTPSPIRILIRGVFVDLSFFMQISRPK